MDAKTGLIFLTFIVILTLQVEAFKPGKLNKIRKHLQDEYKRTTKEILGLKVVYEKQQKMADKLKNVKLDDMPEEDKTMSIGNLEKEITQETEVIKKLLSAEEKEHHELVELFKKIKSKGAIGKKKAASQKE
ncbi:uncharacterized protein [Antedon mediterranea]|uniref:uncharacterized protein n=1 Tax=Antedon mediterranea TaxID=105859 RepID=UPI003AF71901